MIAKQASLVAMEQHAAAFDASEPTEGADDPCTRIHLYQQQLRAELLSAAAAESAPQPWVPSLRPRISPTRAGAGAVARMLESWLRGLARVSTGIAGRQLAALGPVAR